MDHFRNRKPFELENILMQLNGGVLAVSLHGAMGVPIVSVLGSAPLEAIRQLEHIVIDSRKTALSKFDFLHIDKYDGFTVFDAGILTSERRFWMSEFWDP
jgi:hypothetical protein